MDTESNTTLSHQCNASLEQHRCQINQASMATEKERSDGKNLKQNQEVHKAIYQPKSEV